MPSHESTLLNLPLELFRAILAEAVRIRGLKRALRLRLVSRLFSDEITEALCASKLFDQCSVLPSKMPFILPYLKKRLVEHRTTGLMLLNTVHKIAERLAIEDRDFAKFEEYALNLLHLASSKWGNRVRDLFRRGPGYLAPSGFDYELLTAAAYTNNGLLVRSLKEPHLRGKAGVFGNPYQAALLGRHFDILDILFENVRSAYVSDKYRLLQKASEVGDKEMVVFILQSNWSPCKFLNNNLRISSDIGNSLRTPNIEIFNIIMRERETLHHGPLSEGSLILILRNAITKGWVDMTRYIISRAGFRVERAQPLYHACKAGQDEIVKLLLGHPGSVSGAELEAAASHGHASTLKLLLEHNVDIRSEGAKDCVAVAAVKGHLEIVRMLLDAGMGLGEGFDQSMVDSVHVEDPEMYQLLSERGALMTVG